MLEVTLELVMTVKKPTNVGKPPLDMIHLT